jgi:hypothetical protein
MNADKQSCFYAAFICVHLRLTYAFFIFSGAWPSR